MVGFTKRQKQDRSVYLRSPLGSIIYVPQRRAEALLKRAPVTLPDGSQKKYEKITVKEGKANLKEPETSADFELLTEEE